MANIGHDNSQLDPLKLLKCSWDNISRNAKFVTLTEFDIPAGMIGLLDIEDKMDIYVNLDEFLEDITQLMNCYLEKYPDNRRITDATKTVSELCQREVHNIRVCAECYHIWLNSPIYFTKVCSKPHLLVYVKLVDQPYWPAKVMQANANDKFVNVVYFGEHSQENVLATNCILYTDRLPGKMTKNMQVQKAKEEMLVYISNVRQKFGSFQPTAYKTILMPEMYERQRRNMYPGAFPELLEIAPPINQPQVAAGSQADPPRARKTISNGLTARKTISNGLTARKTLTPPASSAENQTQILQNTLLKVGKLERERDYAEQLVELYRKEIERLNQELNVQHSFAPKCATCEKYIGGPFFCDQECKNNFN